jgi:Ca2+-binding RTX toxin-like protein
MSQSKSSLNILFIDTLVADYQQLIDAVLPGTEVILIHRDQDGIDVITDALQGRSQLDSIQVISHGSAGSLQLGTTALNSNTLGDYSAKIETWGNAFTETGDILFYGCNLAENEAGLSLIQNISQFTGADVAASKDLTGSSLLGGDWDLEANTGAIASSLAISEEGRANYTSTLGIPSLTVYDRFLVEGFNSVNSDGYWNRITLSLSNYDQKSSFYIYYSFLNHGLESQGSVSSNDYSDPNSGSFQITPSKVYSKNGQLLVDIPIIINNDSLWDQQEYMDFRLNPTSEYTVTGADQYNNFLQIVTDNHPQVYIGNYWEKPTKTEGEPLRVKDITRIELNLGKEGIPILSGFDLYLDVTGTAIRGSFANTQKGSDYKLFYTLYKRDSNDYGRYIEVDSRKAFPEPVANTSIYKINVPAGTTSIIFQVEDINDEIFEPTETIKITIVEDDVVLGLAKRSSGDKYYRWEYVEDYQTQTINLLENEPIVSLGKVVNPTEGFGYGSTIEGLEEAIALNGTQSVTIPANANLNLANTGKFTLEAWIFPNFTDNNQRDIISYQGGTKTGYPSISIINQTSLQIGFGDGTNWNTLTVDKVLNPKGWNHIASSFDGTDYKVYVNAVEIFSTSNFAGKKPAPTQQLEIGKNFIGAIDEVRIWDSARSAAEIQSLMISELTGAEAGLIGYWDFNKNLTNKANQDSSNPHNGSINGTVEYLNKPAPQIGYIEVNLDKPFQGPQGLWVKYDITSGTATQNSDYFNSRYRKVSTDASSERNGIIIPQGETSAKIYFSALNDAVVEGDETINIKLITHNFDQENLVVNPNIYVVDLENRNVQVFDSQGNFRSTFGSYGTGNGQFNIPQDLVQDQNGNIYVVDSRGYNVQVFDSDGAFLRKFGSQGTGNGQFTDPLNIALDNQGNIYVVDRSRKNIQVFNNSGTFLRQIGSSGTGDGQFSDPQTLAIDKNDNVYVADAGSDNVQVFDNTGKYLRKFNLLRSGIYNTNTVDMAIDSSGNIYLLDNTYYNVQVFSNSGTFLRQFGSQGTGNGQFMQPVSIGVDGNGNIYVGDQYRDDLQIFDGSGNYISKFGSSGSGNGKFNSPTGITIDNRPNSNYGISATNNSATITIKDNQAYTQGVILFDATNQPLSSKNPLAIKNGTADFKIKLTSQPTGNVTVNLSSNNGTLGNTSVTFTSSNWDTLQTVKLNGVSADGNISASASGYFTGNKTFGFTVNPPLKVTEGSSTDAIPVTPEVIISSLGDISEDGGKSGNFVVNLSAPAPTGGLKINYTISGTATKGTDYQNISNILTIPEGETKGIIPILAITDQVTEANETVTITLTTGTGYKLTTDSTKKQATLNITNDDTAGIEVVNAQQTIDSNGNLVTVDGKPVMGYSDQLVAVVTSEPYPNVNNVLQLWDNNNNLLGSVTLTQEQINAGKISLTPTVTLPNLSQLRAILKENSTGLQGFTLDNDKISLNGSTVEVQLPNIGSQGYLAMRLQTKPTADVTVTFNNIDNTETSLDKTTLTFTPENWQQYQVISVIGLDDLEFDGDINYNITAEVTATNDPNYTGKTFSIPIKNLDDDQKVQNQPITTPANNSALPTVTIGSAIAIAENSNNIAQIQVNLSKPATQNTEVIFSIPNGTAIVNQDYQSTQSYLINQFETDGKARFASPFDGVDTGDNAKPTFADLDNDGDLDAVIGTEIGIKYFKNVGSPGIPFFEEQTGSQNPFNNISVSGGALSFADLNNDFTLDLVLGNANGQLTYYVNNGDRHNPRFTLPNLLTPAQTNPFANINVGANATPFLVDFDNDSDRDLIVGSKANGLKYYQNTGNKNNPVFTLATTNPFANITGISLAVPYLTDWDFDQDLDLFIGQENGVISYWENNNNTFTKNDSKNPFAKISNSSTLSTNSAPVLIDLNGDRLRDAFVGVNNGKIDYYEQFNLVTFAPGEQTKTINLQIKDDQIAEGNETLEISLYPNAGYNLGSPQNYVKLDGQDDYVDLPDLQISGDLTIETWTYIDSKTQNFSSILELGNDTGSEKIFFGLRNNQSQFYLETRTNSQTSSYTLSDNLPQQQWVHLAVSVDSQGVGRFYINGELRQTASPFKLPTDILKTVNYLGKSRNGYQFAGQIKNLTVWDKTLNQTEIQTTKDQVLTGSENGLVAYYQGNLDANNSLSDSSPNQLNGTLNNGALVKNDPITTTVTIVDNDVAGVTIAKVTGTNTSETGNSVSYSVKLNSQPTAPVTVYLGSQDETEALVTVKSDLTSLAGVASLVFTPDNWNQTQTFYVKGVDEQIDDDDKSYQIITTVSSEDQKYNKLAVNDLSLINIDNDQAGFIIKGAGKAIEGRENIYSIKLSSQPLGEIRLIMTPTNDQIRLNNQLVGEPLTLIFTPQNWNFEQTVRATALDDTVVEYLHYSAINFKVETGKGLDFESKADNNTPENALDLGTIKGGYNWSNLAISTATDVDWFKFTIPDTGNNLNFARINFDNAKGNLKLEVYSAKNLTTPILIADSSTNTNNFEQISLNGQPLGTYYLKISGAVNNYDLIVADADYKYTQVIPTSLPVVIQDNDLPTATLIAGPTASEVFAEPSYFTVQLNAPLPKDGSGINVNYRVVGGSATFPEDRNSNGILDAGEDVNNNGKLDLGDYQVQKEGVVRIAPGDIQNNLIIAPIDDKLVEDLKLTVKSVTPGANSNELILNVSSSLTKIISQSTDEPFGADYPTTNNTTGRLLVGDFVLGSWTNSSDQDSYAVYLEANKTYTFDLEKSGNSNPYLYLYNSNGTLLGSNDNTGSNLNSRLTYTPTVSGNYYARTSSNSADSYRLSAKNIVSNSNSKSEGTTDLPNNTTTTGVISVGEQVTGNISDSSDQDWYKVNLKAGITYVFDIMGNSLGDGTLATPNVYIYDTNGQQIIAQPANSEIKGGRVQMHFTPASSGNYYVSALSRSYQFSGTYKLAVSEVIPYREPITSLTPEIIAGSKLRFDKNLTATISKGATLTYNSNGLYEGNITVTVDEPLRKSEIVANSPARIAEETVIVELLPGDGYILPANSKATLRIQDDDVPGVRIVQVGDNTVVREGETASFQVALLSEPTAPVTITLTPGFEIDFVNPVNPTTVKVTKDIYTFDETNGGNLDVNLVSLVTGEKEKTVSFGVNLKVIPSSNVIVEFSDGNNDLVKDNPVFKTLLFTATESNSVTGSEPGNWNQVQQVILGYLDPDTSGNLKVKAVIKDATTGQQIGNQIIFPIIRTTTQVDKQTTEITIQPEDWYKLQTVTFTGIDEQLAEPGLYHQSSISYQVDSKDSEYKGLFVPVQRVDVVDRPLNPESTSQTVKLGLTNLQQSLDNLEIPMVGALDGKMPDLIGDISDKLVVAISAEPELTGNRLKTVIENALSTLGLDFVNVGVDMTEDNIGILLNVKEKYDLFSLPLDVNLGLDALGIGLKTEGDLKTTFDFNIDLGFGLNKDFGFYIDTKQTKVKAAFRIDLQDFQAQGNLAFLRLDMADDPKNHTELAINFEAGLKDLDNYQTIKFFDVDGDRRLDADSFTYPIKTNNSGKPATTDTGEFITTNQVVQEPFINVNVQGIAPAFPTVASATAPQKLLDWNANGKFDTPFQTQNEGVYLTKKVASTTPGGQPTIQSYYFDLNRNGSLDVNSKEKLFSVAPGTTKWFDATGKLKPFTIEQKNVNGVVTYYFDQNGNNVLDTGETLTSQEKAKFDKNNNNILDADEAGLGEGKFVQGTGIAFLDSNNNGQLDATESYVYSEFNEFDLETEKKIVTYNILTVGAVTFLDQNKNGTYEEANDLDLLKAQPITVTEAALLGLPGAGNYTIAQILNLTVANNKVMDTEISFVNSKGDVAKKLDIKEEPLVRIKEGVRFIDKDNNGKLTLDNFDPLKSNIYTYKVLTSGTTTFLDQNNNGVYDSGSDLNLFANVTITQEQSEFVDLPAGTYPVHQILKLTLNNGQIQETEISFVNTVNAKTDTAKKLDVGDEPLLRTRSGLTFVDNDNNGAFTLDDEKVINELFTLPNNEFDTTTLTGTGNIVKLLDDGDRLTIQELKNWKSDPNSKLTDLFNYELAGNANLGLKTKTSIEGDPAFPSVAFDLAIGLPIFNYGNQTQAGSTGLDVNFNNITLDFGTFLTDFAAPIMKKVDDIISPVKPVIDILNADTKLFSYLGMENQFNRDGRPGVSILDLGIVLAEAIPANTTDPNLKRIKDSVPKAVKFVDTITKIVELNENLIELAESGSSIILPLGSYNLNDFKGASDDPADTAAKVDAGTQGTQTPAPGVTPGTTPAQQAQNSATASSQQKSTLSKLQSLDGIQIPILDNPITLVRLLLGEEDVDLIKYDIPDLNYYFGKEQKFLLWTPPTVEGILGLYFDAKTDFSVGYDTHGLESWRDDGFDIASIYKVLDGFYVDDLNPDGVDKDELSVKAGIYAGLSASVVVAKAILKGGVDGYLGFDLVDEGELQGTSDGKVRGSEIISRISNPLSLFDLKGSLDAYLKGEIKVGIDFGFFEIMKTVWEEEFRLNLARFNIGANGVTISFAGQAVDGLIVGGRVFLDANLNGQWDEDEPFTFTNRNGQFTLNILDADFNKFDLNSNGAIDLSEGRIAMTGGIDSGSDLPFEGILTAAVGSEVVTPFTSLVERVARLNPEGFSITQAEELVTNNLQLFSAGFFHPELQVIATGETISSVIGPGGIIVETSELYQLDVTDQVLLSDNFDELKAQKGWISLDVNLGGSAVDHPPMIDINPKTGKSETLNYAPRIDDKSYQYLLGAQIQLASEQLALLTGKPINEVLDHLAAKINSGTVTLSSFDSSFFPSDFTKVQKLAAGLAINEAIITLGQAAYKQVDYNGDGIGDNGYGFDSETYDIYHEIFRINSKMQIISENLQKLLPKISRNELDISFAQFNDDFSTSGLYAKLNNATGIAVNVFGPESVDFARTINEDSSYTFQLSDFTFIKGDPDDVFKSVYIEWSVDQGSLKLGSQFVTSGMEINVSDIAAGLLTFTPQANKNGNNYTHFNFRVADGKFFTDHIHTMTFNVTGVNDAPVVNKAIATQTAFSNTAFNFSFANDIFKDLEDNSLTYSATLADGSALPTWLTFNAIERRFSGTPTVTDATNLTIKITATDSGHLSTSTNLKLNVFNSINGTAQNDILNGTDGNDTLNGGLGDDTLNGGLGHDTLNGASGNDTLNGGLGHDTLNGASGNDTLKGDLGNDILNGGTDADILIGGDGDDIYHIDHIGDIVSEAPNQGMDLINSSLTYTLGANVENLTLTGNTAINGTGNGLDNRITGNSAANTLTGGAGNDTLNGGMGADTLIGGVGNDTYYVDNTGDIITENLAQGTDLVYATANYTLANNVENLTLTGTTNINGAGNNFNNIITGNTGNNTLTGNAGNDTLIGGVGVDTLIGGLGNDIYYVDNTGDIITENLNQGTDVVFATANYTISNNVENLTLTGSAAINGTGNVLNNIITGNNGSNILTGNAGNDTLIGGVGVDTLIGGLGNDIYYVDNTGDIITENLNQGTDVVFATANYTISNNVENLTLTGSAAINGTGNVLNNIITGNNGSNILTGNAGNDTLIGGLGKDTLIGGVGNDIYYVDNTGDIITENLNEGTDTVNSSINYTLAANVENLTLTNTAYMGTGNALNNTITGNASDNYLVGNAGNDTLNGGAGADILIGGAGNDIYSVDDGGDIVLESLNEGADTVKSSINYTLGINLENLTLTGTNAIDGNGNALNNTITGNSGNNTLSGNAGNDILTGNAGNDILVGGTGNDLLTGGTGADIFRFNTTNEGTDTIKDFKLAESDIIQISAGGFAGGLAVGTLDVSQLISGVGITSATNGLQRFIYNSSNGALFYDVDGNGVGTKVQIATLNGLPALNSGNIEIIS